MGHWNPCSVLWSACLKGSESKTEARKYTLMRARTGVPFIFIIWRISYITVSTGSEINIFSFFITTKKLHIFEHIKSFLTHIYSNHLDLGIC